MRAVEIYIEFDKQFTDNFGRHPDPLRFDRFVRNVCKEYDKQVEENEGLNEEIARLREENELLRKSLPDHRKIYGTEQSLALLEFLMSDKDYAASFVQQAFEYLDEAQRLRKTLDFYANKENYHSQQCLKGPLSGVYRSFMEIDNGEKARVALKTNAPE